MAKRAGQFRIGFLVCSVVGLFFATQIYLLYNEMEGRELSWGRAIRSQLMTWYLWGLLSVLVIRLARRFPLERPRVGRAILIHVPASVICALLHLALSTTWFWGVEGTVHTAAEWRKSYRFMVLVNFNWYVLTYASILAFVHAWEYYRRFREREVSSARLSAELAKAQLGALEMQLHPHFLFNTLNAMTTLVHEDPAAAELMITRLSDLLRAVLRHEAGQCVSLGDELEFIGKYLEIERVRFQDRLTIKWKIEDDCREATVPNLILQPFVENAVRHGVSRVQGPCSIEVRAGRADDRLIVEVVDDGPGPQAGERSGAGMGLKNARERLQQLFGINYEIALNVGEKKGCRARISMPFVKHAAEGK